MKARGGGVVINLASVQAFVSQNNVAAYTTSKTAILGLTRSIAVEYAPTIRCVAVCPGTVDTPMLRDAIKLSPDPNEVLEECNQMHPVKRIGTPEEVAELIVFLASDKASFITGQPIRIDGGLGLSIGGSKR
jgi:NAD(P)-dependent dehydrogenase (short-subunit alcohol dehydrogenase family)